MSNSCFRFLCCFGASPSYSTGDVNIKVSKSHMDEMLIEKIQAKATIQRLQNMNDKLNNNMAELQAELDEREREISRLEAIYGYKSPYKKADQSQQHGHGDYYSHENRLITVQHIDGVIAKPRNSSFNQAGVARFSNYTEHTDTRPPLTKKTTSGVDFEKYLIKEGQGTRSWFRFPQIDKDGEIVSTDEMITYIEGERFSSWISFQKTDEEADDKLDNTCNTTTEKMNKIETSWSSYEMIVDENGNNITTTKVKADIDKQRTPSWFSFQTVGNKNIDEIKTIDAIKIDIKCDNGTCLSQKNKELSSKSSSSARSMITCGTRMLDINVDSGLQVQDTRHAKDITHIDEEEDNDDDECGFWFYK